MVNVTDKLLFLTGFRNVTKHDIEYLKLTVQDYYS